MSAWYPIGIALLAVAAGAVVGAITLHYQRRVLELEQKKALVLEHSRSKGQLARDIFSRECFLCGLAVVFLIFGAICIYWFN